MLSRNLLYTALTRARRTVVIIGSTRAIAIAMNSTEAMIRYTGLTEALSDRSFPQPGLIN
jgi:exodeoxyribonuclease V alpha subunit